MCEIPSLLNCPGDTMDDIIHDSERCYAIKPIYDPQSSFSLANDLCTESGMKIANITGKQLFEIRFRNFLDENSDMFDDITLQSGEKLPGFYVVNIPGKRDLSGVILLK